MPVRHKSIKMVRKDRLKRFFNRRLIEALHHPVREHFLAVTNERAASMVEIGDELGLDVVAFNKQVKVLERLGFIEVVGTRPTRGGTEHFYRATRTVFFDDRVWQDVPATLKADLDADFVQSLIDDLVAAFNGGTYHARRDKHQLDPRCLRSHGLAGSDEAPGKDLGAPACDSAAEPPAHPEVRRAGDPGHHRDPWLRAEPGSLAAGEAPL